MQALKMLIEARDNGDPFDMIVANPDPALGQDFATMLELAEQFNVLIPGILTGYASCDFHGELAEVLGFELVTDLVDFNDKIRRGSWSMPLRVAGTA